jgi:hypothetical protein
MMPTIKTGLPHSKRECPTTTPTSFNNRCRYVWVILHYHWNIGQYWVLMNSISGMFPKCSLERSIFCYNNTSSTTVWANGSLDRYPASWRPDIRTCYILYLILNQYYQKPSLIPWSITSICSITLHRLLWEHLVNRRVSRGTYLSKDSSMLWRSTLM